MFKIISASFANHAFDINRFNYAIEQRGVKMKVEIMRFWHKTPQKFAKKLSVTCSQMKRKKHCHIYCAVKEQYQYTLENLKHIQDFTHHENEIVAKPAYMYIWFAVQQLQKISI